MLLTTRHIARGSPLPLAPALHPQSYIPGNRTIADERKPGVIAAFRSPAPKSFLIPVVPAHAVRVITSSAKKQAEASVPVKPAGGGGHTAPILPKPRREVPLLSQEPTKGLVQYALYVSPLAPSVYVV